MKVQISKYMLNKCEAFAEARMPGSSAEYKRRGEGNFDKMKHDIFIGAAAEAAVYKALTEAGLDCTKPDFNIYEKRDKSYSADLNVNGLNLHVKSQSIKSAKRYGASWLFQKTDKLFKEENQGDLLVFCLVDDDNNVTLEAIIDVETLVKEDLIGVPKIPMYARTKNAIYLEQVLESNKGDVQAWIQRLK